MKQRILSTIAILLCCVTTIFAQNNDRISYQAVVRDANNNLVVNQELTVQVTVNDGQNTYTETHTVTSNANGLISFLIGDGTNASNNWDNLNWKTAAVSTTMSVGGVQIAAHTMPLTTVPSAKYADYADSVNPDVVARQIHDTADIVRQKVGDVSEKVVNLENRLKADSANLKDHYYTKTQVDTAKTQIRTTMAANDAQLQINIDTASSQIRTDMAAMNTNLGNGIAENKQAIIDSTAHVRDNLRDTALTLRGLIKTTDDKFANYYTTAQIDQNVDSVKGNIRNEIGALKTNADAIYATKAKVKADSTTLKGYIDAKANAADVYDKSTMNAKLSDTARYATKAKVKADSTTLKGYIDAKANTADVYDKSTMDNKFADTVRYATKAKVKADSNVVFDTLHNYYATKSSVASQLSNYTTTAELQTNYATKTDLNDYTTTAVLEANYATKDEVATGLNLKANAADVYDISTMNAILSDTARYATKAALANIQTELGVMHSDLAHKANANNVYTKTETNGLLNDKANADDVYTKTETDGLLVDKADANNVYNKTEINNILLSIREVSDKFIATDNQDVFALSNKPTHNNLVKMYINGILVGDNEPVFDEYYDTYIAVIDQVEYSPNPNNNKYNVHYRSDYNDNYVLRAGDKVVFYYYTIDDINN